MSTQLTTMKPGQLVIVVAMLLVSGCSNAVRESCVARSPQFQGAGVGYELVNVAAGDVWATRDWAPDEFDELSLPLAWVFWFKNDPRVGVADHGTFLRSPGCGEDGQYNYMHAFNRNFVQVVELISRPRATDDQTLIRRTELEKYHVLHFFAGRTVSILRSPTGERFIGVSRSLDRTSEPPALPPGWSLTDRLLTEDLQVNLLQQVSVLRLENEDSYQGPIPAFTEWVRADSEAVTLAPDDPQALPGQGSRASADIRRSR